MLQTVVQWLRQMPYEDYQRAWVNMTTQSKTRAMAERQTTSISHALFDAFSWQASTEGHCYWQKVYDKYVQDEASLNKDCGVSCSEQPAPNFRTTGAAETHQLESEEMIRMFRHNGTYCDSAYSIQE